MCSRPSGALELTCQRLSKMRNRKEKIEIHIDNIFSIYDQYIQYMVVDRIMEMEKRFVMGQQTTAARRGPIFP